MCAKQYKLDNPTAVIGELARRLQARYGDEVLSVFRDVLGEYGRQSGAKLRKKMADMSYPERVIGWLEPFIRNNTAQIVDSKPGSVTVKAHDCPLNLEGSNEALCNSLMRLDEGLVSALAEHNISLTIEKSLARSDEHCLVTFALKK